VLTNAIWSRVVALQYGKSKVNSHKCVARGGKGGAECHKSDTLSGKSSAQRLKSGAQRHKSSAEGYESDTLSGKSTTKLHLINSDKRKVLLSFF